MVCVAPVTKDNTNGMERRARGGQDQELSGDNKLEGEIRKKISAFGYS